MRNTQSCNVLAMFFLFSIYKKCSTCDWHIDKDLQFCLRIKLILRFSDSFIGMKQQKIILHLGGTDLSIDTRVPGKIFSSRITAGF